MVELRIPGVRRRSKLLCAVYSCSAVGVKNSGGVHEGHSWSAREVSIVDGIDVFLESENFPY